MTKAHKPCADIVIKRGPSVHIEVASKIVHIIFVYTLV